MEVVNIVFRTDSSFDIGSGNVMRCLTLADELRDRGADVSFISRALPGNMCDLIEAKGYRTLCLPAATETGWQQDAEHTIDVIRGLGAPISWLIVDHYELDRQWEELLRPKVERIMVIDDLADRPHDCDLLLDQNLCTDRGLRYDALVPAHCRKLLGPQHALLRREFLAARKDLRERDGTVRHILVFFGGTDPSGETLKALDALRLLNEPALAVDVVVGASNPRKEEVRRRCDKLPNVAYHCQVDTMAFLMAKADLAIGAGGSTNWERCYLGLPTIAIIIAENQMPSTDALAAAGAVRNLGWHEDADITRLAVTLREMIADPACLREMSARAFAVMGGTSSAQETALIDVILGAEHAAS